jgi:pilus assembly protein CpaB
VLVIGEAPDPVAAAPSASASHPAEIIGTTGGGPATTAERYVVTLAVGPKDAPRLVHAARYCALHLALLGSTVTVTPGDGVDTDGLYR